MEQYRINPVAIADATFSSILVEMYGELKFNRSWDHVFDTSDKVQPTESAYRPTVRLEDCDYLYSQLELYLPHAWKTPAIQNGEEYTEEHLQVFFEYETWAELIADSREV